MYITKVNVFIDVFNNKSDDKYFIIIMKIKKIYVDNILFNDIIFIKIKKI